MKDLPKLDMLQRAANDLLNRHPNNRVAQDMDWLCRELRTAWLLLERKNRLEPIAVADRSRQRY